MIFTKTNLQPDDAAVNKNTNSKRDQTMIDKTMEDIKSGKGLAPIGNNVDRSNKKIMADINAGKGIPPIGYNVKGKLSPIPDDSSSTTPDDYYDDGSYSCITAMEKCFGQTAVSNFCLCNALKYIWRCQKKHETPIEDLKKARWYLDRLIQYLEQE